MRHLLFLLTFLPLLTTAQADTTTQKPPEHATVTEAPDFYYYIIGNWRNGPEVLIGPPMPGSEQKTMDQMMKEAVAALPDFKGVEDKDIVIEPSIETAEHSRRLLGAKYQSRDLKVKLLK